MTLFNVFSLLAVLLLPAFLTAKEVRVEFGFTPAASKVFVDTLILSKNELPEVIIQNVKTEAPIQKAVCSAYVLKPDWSLEEDESNAPDSRIQCVVEQDGMAGSVVFDLGKTTIYRHGNRTQHQKAFAIKGDLSDRLLKALLKLHEAEPTNKMLNSSEGMFATKGDAMLDANIKLDQGADLVTIDCYLFTELTKEKTWKNSMQGCAFATDESAQ
jgi:hypothetical protein